MEGWIRMALRLWGRLLLGLYRLRQRRTLRQAGFQKYTKNFEGTDLCCYANVAISSFRAQAGHRRKKPVLVFLHGFLDSSLSFRYVAFDLARDYEILLLDLPGFGHSRLPAIRELWHLDSIARLCARFVFEELKLKSIVLCTHSMGGLIAAHLILYQKKYFPKARVEALHAIAPAILRFSPRDRQRIRQGFYTQSLDELKRLLSDLSYRREWEAPHSVLLALLAEWSYIGYEYLALNTLEREKEVFFSEDTLSGLRLPVHLYWGRQDRMTPPGIARRLHRALPNAELHWFSQAGHALHIELRTEFASCLKELLAL